MILDLVSYRFKHMITDIHVIIFARSLHNPKEKDIPQENGTGKNHFKIIDILKSQLYRFFSPVVSLLGYQCRISRHLNGVL